MARATPLQKPYGTIQKCAVEADRGFNNHLAGDSGFGRPVKRPTRFKDPLKQSALSAGALSAGALSAEALRAGALSAVQLRSETCSEPVSCATGQSAARGPQDNRRKPRGAVRPSGLRLPTHPHVPACASPKPGSGHGRTEIVIVTVSFSQCNGKLP